MRTAAPSLVLHAALAVLLAGAGPANAQEAPAVAVQAVGDAVVFKGQINARSAAEFLRLLREDPKITRLVISSRGGMVTAALDMALAVHERQLDVEVPVACMSSCANYVFPAGRNKTVGRPDAVAWHGNMTHVLYLQQTGQASWNEDQIEGARQLAVREAQFYRRIGVDGFACWFGKIAPYNVDDFYSLSASDMQRFGIGHVTVRDASPGDPGNGEVRQVRVDWAGLEAARPAVRLEP
jgi:hypothetical protein